ncbi:hypothetical protein K0B03_02310 [Patescibacteria group bacterium]|nr:hypothetical protein [Patescibacteria group bacterium]
MKKEIYIFLFIILGILLSFLLHALIEISYINLLWTNYERYGMNLKFSQLYTIHTIGTIIILGVGIIFGFIQGKFWWKKIYIEKMRNR